MKTYTICGSMRFENEMKEIALKLETEYGLNILQCTYSKPDKLLTESQIGNIEQAHYRKIDISDGIYVVDVDGYIGDSVKQEIEYAIKNGKEVLFHSIFT